MNVIAAAPTSTVTDPTSSNTGGQQTGGGGSVAFGGSTSNGGGATAGGSVLGAETFNFAKDLRYGMTNSDVMELQKRLAKEGFFKVAPTGYFGPITLAAAKKYQLAHKIKPVSGFVGPLTRAELNK